MLSEVRIIPARAGFTVVHEIIKIPRKDHPRSRGVYQRLKDDALAEKGSSPLARGLRDWGASELTARGIIPARAGFTSHGDGRVQESTDHPRSRGVYE